MNSPLELKVMMYHYVRDPGDAAEAGSGIPGMPVSEFESQLDDLARQHTFVGWPEVRIALGDNSPLPESACLLTFDDGIRDHYIHIFRILRERNISGLFFIIDRSKDQGLILAHKIHFLLAKLGVDGLRDAIWRKLNDKEKEQFTWAEIKYREKYPLLLSDGSIDLLKAVLQRDLSVLADSLLGELVETHLGSERVMARNHYLTREQIHSMSAGGMHFGGHSRTHPWFDWIDTASREKEIAASAAWLQPIERGPWAFAYPYGGLSDDSPELLGKLGFAAAFTTRSQLHHTDPYFIGRLDGEEIAQAGSRYA